MLDLGIITYFDFHCDSHYDLSNEAMKSIQSGNGFEPFSWTSNNTMGLFKLINRIFKDSRSREVSQNDLESRIRGIFLKNDHLLFCRHYLESDSLKECTQIERLLFLYICKCLVLDKQAQVEICMLEERLGWLLEADEIISLIGLEITALQNQGLVAFGGNQGFLDKEKLTLTEPARKFFLPDVKAISMSLNGNGGALIPNANITPKELFYNKAEIEQMDRLASLLDEANYQNIRKRLDEKGMRKGFAVLFTGGAGCGKTAGTYELARRTGRDIVAVDMSELKSKWVGDSERIVKGVFDYYASLCKESSIAPILLFNEADAIFSKRLSNPSDSVDMMMNTIQNICLESIENLDGILIATTNLSGNFCDDAFSRRFIYKINFTTPEADTRTKIWKSMIKDLTDDDAAFLGERYSFTGGIIENVARKVAVDYVLYGINPGRSELCKICDEEMALKTTKRTIGF